jgi:hypothetical protein
VLLGGTLRPYRTRSLTTGIAGIAAAVGLSMGQGLMQVGGYEPPFDAPAVEIQTFFETRSSSLFAVGSYLQALSLILFLWFLAGVCALLREAEGEGPWRANLALVSGVVVVATTILGSWELAVFRADAGLDAQVARLVFDMGNLSFASAWVALGSFSLASGWVMASARSVPRWLGWWAIVAGAGLVAVRAIWTAQLWLIPYALFWIWVVVVSVRLIGDRPIVTQP